MLTSVHQHEIHSVYVIDRQILADMDMVRLDDENGREAKFINRAVALKHNQIMVQ